MWKFSADIGFRAPGPFDPTRFGAILILALVFLAEPLFGQSLFNVDFGSSASLSPSSFAAVRLTTNDYWNSNPATEWKLADGSNSLVSVRVAMNPEAAASSNSLPYFSVPAASMDQRIVLTVEGLPAGLHGIYLYGVNFSDGPVKALSSSTTVMITSGGINFGTKTPSVNPSWQTEGNLSGSLYVPFPNLELPPGQPVIITITTANNEIAYLLNALQIYLDPTVAPRLSSSIFTSIERLANGSIRMQLVGPRGAVVGVESSTNLLEWSRLTTITNTGVNIEFADPSGAGLPMRFFRVVPP